MLSECAEGGGTTRSFLLTDFIQLANDMTLCLNRYLHEPVIHGQRLPVRVRGLRC